MFSSTEVQNTKGKHEESRRDAKRTLHPKLHNQREDKLFFIVFTYTYHNGPEALKNYSNDKTNTKIEGRQNILVGFQNCFIYFMSNVSFAPIVTM